VPFKRGEDRGVSLAFLNPPYDFDREYGRLEERFLRRYTEALADRGVLVFLVPFYALAASANTLAQHYTDLHCFRFPEGDFEVFKQVVLVARRHASLRQPDPALVARVRAWSEDAASIPVLPARPAPVASLPDHPEYPEPLDGWEVAPMDLTGLLAEVQPWTASDRGGRAQPIPGVTPPADGSDLLARSYPTAMPPRAAHVASAIAAGVFNGARLEPDASSSPLPPVLVKGTFDREFRTVEEKTNKDGAITGLVQVQQPKLSVTALDLRTKRYHTLRNSTDLSSATRVGELTTADLIDRYSKALVETLHAHCPVLHDPARPEDGIPLPALGRPLYTAQAHAVMATVKLLGGLDAKPHARRGRAAFVLGRDRQWEVQRGARHGEGDRRAAGTDPLPAPPARLVA
jgi:hypothetical protein